MRTLLAVVAVLAAALIGVLQMGGADMVSDFSRGDVSDVGFVLAGAVLAFAVGGMIADCLRSIRPIFVVLACGVILFVGGLFVALVPSGWQVQVGTGLLAVSAGTLARSAVANSYLSSVGILFLATPWRAASSTVIDATSWRWASNATTAVLLLALGALIWIHRKDPHASALDRFHERRGAAERAAKAFHLAVGNGIGRPILCIGLAMASHQAIWPIVLLFPRYHKSATELAVTVLVGSAAGLLAGGILAQVARKLPRAVISFGLVVLIAGWAISLGGEQGIVVPRVSTVLMADPWVSAMTLALALITAGSETVRRVFEDTLLDAHGEPGVSLAALGGGSIAALGPVAAGFALQFGLGRFSVAGLLLALLTVVACWLSQRQRSSGAPVARPAKLGDATFVQADPTVAQFPRRSSPHDWGVAGWPGAVKPRRLTTALLGRKSGLNVVGAIRETIPMRVISAFFRYKAFQWLVLSAAYTLVVAVYPRPRVTLIGAGFVLLWFAITWPRSRSRRATRATQWGVPQRTRRSRTVPVWLVLTLVAGGATYLFESKGSITPSKTPTTVTIAAAANELARLRVPYCLGGGHVDPAKPTPPPAGHDYYCRSEGGARIPPRDAGLDSSGALSWVLQHAGVNAQTMSSHELARWGRQGKGKVTIWVRPGEEVRPGHVFLQIGRTFWGTDAENYRGGFGRHGPRSSAGFIARHVPGVTD